MTSAAAPVPGTDPSTALELVPGAGEGPHDHGPVPRLVDWDVALATARRLTKPGPAVSATEARAVVADLRVRAGAAEAHVKDFTGMSAPPGSAPVVVVDRPGWVQANSSAFDEVLAPLARLVAKKRKDGEQSGSGRGGALSAKVAGVEAGALLAYLSSKVLGQFDPFYAGGGATGRLLLVAPNVLHVERELEVDPTDFRTWVCVHEETHRVQFTAVPWLRDYLRTQVQSFVAETDVDPAALADRLRDALGAVVGSFRGQGDFSLIELVQTPRQREILDRMVGLMSLLEGHAEYVMDGVGPDVIPTVEDIRKKFTKRRAGAGPVDQALRRLLGLEMKMKQYRDGAVFVRTVVDQIGRDSFNRVWTSPQTLPTRDEISDPDGWIRRVSAL